MEQFKWSLPLLNFRLTRKLLINDRDSKAWRRLKQKWKCSLGQRHSLLADADKREVWSRVAKVQDVDLIWFACCTVLQSLQLLLRTVQRKCNLRQSGQLICESGGRNSDSDLLNLRQRNITPKWEQFGAILSDAELLLRNLEQAKRAWASTATTELGA